MTFNPNADVAISGTGGGKHSRQTIKVTPKSTGVKLAPTDWDSLSFSSGLGPNERILTLDAASYTPHYKGQERCLADLRHGRPARQQGHHQNRRQL